jgi:FtsH-binding integral membrane protein
MAAAAAPSRTGLPPPPAASSVGAYDRAFYSGMAIALALTVFAGFAPTYYLRLFSGGPRTTISGAPLTSVIHVHAALFTAWVVLLVVQTALVASHHVSVHRRLGIAGAILAAAMVVAGMSAAITTARHAAASGQDLRPSLTIPVFDMILFPTFVAAALVMRRDKEAHKRLMLLASISIIVAAVARLPWVVTLRPLAFFALAGVFIAVAVVYDLVSRRRVHKVYVWGGGVLVASVPARLMLGETRLWLRFADLLTR